MCFQVPAKPHKGLVESPEGSLVFTQGQVHRITKVHSLFIPMQRPNESVELLRLEVFETTKHTKRLRDFLTLAFTRLKNPDQFKDHCDRRRASFRATYTNPNP